MRTIFQNPSLEEAFRKDGYVIVPFLESQEIEQLAEVYHKHTLEMDMNFHLSIWKRDVENRAKVHEKIQAFFLPKAQKIFQDYKCIISSFAVKKAAQNSAWHIHQDDNFTDEHRFSSASIWCPLVDVNANNGAMQVLKHSHRIFTDVLRCPTIPKSFDIYKPHIQEKYLTTIPMKAGEAMIFDHKLVHASGANMSGKLRLAAVSVYIPQEAPLQFFYKNPSDTSAPIERLELVEDFYLRFPLGDKPEGEGVKFDGYFEEALLNISYDDFVKLYQQYEGIQPVKARKWWQRLFARNH